MFVKLVGWKFAEKEKKAEAERLSIRWKFGLNPSDVVVFIVGTWGPYNLYHTYGDRIFDVIRELAGHYKVIVSAHYNDFRKTRYHNADKVTITILQWNIVCCCDVRNCV